MKFTKKLRNAVARKMMYMTIWSANRIVDICRSLHNEEKESNDEFNNKLGQITIEIGHLGVTVDLDDWSRYNWCSAYKLIDSGCNAICSGLKLQGRASDVKYIEEQLQKYCGSIIEHYDMFKYDN